MPAIGCATAMAARGEAPVNEAGRSNKQPFRPGTSTEHFGPCFITHPQLHLGQAVTMRREGQASGSQFMRGAAGVVQGECTDGDVVSVRPDIIPDGGSWGEEHQGDIMLSHQPSLTSSPSPFSSQNHSYEASLIYGEHNNIEDIIEEREGQIRNEGNWFDDEGEEFVREYMDLPPPSPIRRTNLRPRIAARIPFIERAPPPSKPTQGNQKSSGIKRAQWIDYDLKMAIDALNHDYTIGEVSQAFNIPRTSLKDQYEGKIKGRKMGPKATLTIEEEEKLVQYMEEMVKLAHPLSPNDLKLKVAEICQSRETPFKDGIPGRSWLKWFKKRHHFVMVLRGKGTLSTTSRHLLILDRHKAHLTLEVLTKAKRNGIDMVSLPSHTSHGLHPLDVSCFEPFKVAFRAYKSMWSVNNHGAKVRKEDLANWVSLALKRALTTSNIKAGFRGSGIWPLNFQAMQSKWVLVEDLYL